jgi:hypothetical protein
MLSRRSVALNFKANEDAPVGLLGLVSPDWLVHNISLHYNTFIIHAIKTFTSQKGID